MQRQSESQPLLSFPRMLDVQQSRLLKFRLQTDLIVGLSEGQWTGLGTVLCLAELPGFRGFLIAWHCLREQVYLIRFFWDMKDKFSKARSSGISQYIKIYEAMAYQITAEYR